MHRPYAGGGGPGYGGSMAGAAPPAAPPAVAAASVVRVSNIPPFVDPPELTRIFSGSNPSRVSLGNGAALITYPTAELASSAVALYHGWTGWGPPLVLALEGSSSGGGGGGGAPPPPLKRSREGAFAEQQLAGGNGSGPGGGYFGGEWWHHMLRVPPGPCLPARGARACMRACALSLARARVGPVHASKPAGVAAVFACSPGAHAPPRKVVHARSHGAACERMQACARSHAPQPVPASQPSMQL